MTIVMRDVDSPTLQFAVVSLWKSPNLWNQIYKSDCFLILGPSRGVCQCGECKCEPGYTGAVCDCPVSTDSCERRMGGNVVRTI